MHVLRWQAKNMQRIFFTWSYLSIKSYWSDHLWLIYKLLLSPINEIIDRNLKDKKHLPISINKNYGYKFLFIFDNYRIRRPFHFIGILPFDFIVLLPLRTFHLFRNILNNRHLGSVAEKTERYHCGERYYCEFNAISIKILKWL